MNGLNENKSSKVSVPQQERSKEKRQALLKSGEELFSSRGYDQVTAKDICAHAGISVGSFYRYFSDKKQLLLTLIEQTAQSFLPDVIDMSGSHPYQTTKHLLETYLSKTEFGLLNALQSLVLQDTETRMKVNKTIRLAEEKLADRLEELKRVGLTWPDLDVKIAAWAVLSIIFSTNDRIELRQSGEDIERITKVIVRMLFRSEFHVL
ncbi:TetR/AcrR family transcriptional regulator [Paenibacillus glucanolyticus]